MFLNHVCKILSYHVTDNVKTTCYITLSAGTCNVMTTSIATMQIFIENKQTSKAIESHLKLT